MVLWWEWDSAACVHGVGDDGSWPGDSMGATESSLCSSSLYNKVSGCLRSLCKGVCVCER